MIPGDERSTGKRLLWVPRGGCYAPSQSESTVPLRAPGKYRVLARCPASPGSGSLKADPQLVTLSERDHKTVQLVIVKPQTE